jgi:mxaJ protein
VLRVCSDPNNLPFSNERGEGFENELAELLARELDARLEYTFWAQRRGFVRNTLKAGLCDVVMGVPSTLEMVLTTRPYYRSSYVFVTRKDRQLALHSFDDPRLRKLKIGVPIVGDDYANTPPAHALARRAIVDNVVGFSVFGDYAEPNPPAALIHAVEAGKIDVGVAWGPLAGYFAKHSRTPLSLVRARPDAQGPGALAFDISLGVRKPDAALRDELEGVLVRRKREIAALLARFGVPRI